VGVLGRRLAARMGLVFKIAAGIILAVVVLAVGTAACVRAEVRVEGSEAGFEQTYDDAYEEEDVYVDEPYEEESPVEPWTPPAGFDAWGDGIGWRWVKDPDCSYGTCWQVEVVTRDGCEGTLAVTIDVLSADDVLVGQSHDFVDYLDPGQIARLELITTEDDAAEGRMSEIAC
jgi:hypothetical protein